MLEAVTSFLLIFTAVGRDYHPADNTWAKTIHHVLHWRGSLHLFQLLQQRTHGWVHHAAGSSLRAASAADPHRDLQECLFPVERASVTQRHRHQVGAATGWACTPWLEMVPEQFELELHGWEHWTVVAVVFLSCMLVVMFPVAWTLSGKVFTYSDCFSPEQDTGENEGRKDELLWVEVIVWQLWLCNEIVVSSTGSEQRPAVWS